MLTPLSYVDDRAHSYSTRVFISTSQERTSTMSLYSQRHSGKTKVWSSVAKDVVIQRDQYYSVQESY